MLITDLREVFKPNWSGFHPRAALRCVPAIAIAIALGHFSGRPEWGVMAAAGAVSVGFGSFQELNGSRVAPMLYATFAMCIASWVGTFAGQDNWSAVALIAVAGFLYVAISGLGTGYSWITLQAAIWLIISTAYPASGLHALLRGSCVLAGGAIQIILIEGFWALERRRTPAKSGTPIMGSCTSAGFLSAFDVHSCSFAFALRAAATLGSATALSRFTQIPNGYWIPMTCVIVLRGDVRQSVVRGLARVSGTMIGAVLATLIASVLRPPAASLAGLILFFAWLGYAFLWVNYAVFVTLLTSYVVFLLAFAGLPEAVVIHHRLLNTLMGGAIALAWHGIFFAWEERASRRTPALESREFSSHS
jgi:hypothetical protein